MKAVSFVLLREGSSDEELVTHLGNLLVRAGCSEAVGTHRPYKLPVENQLRLLAEEGASIDIVFVHRDADARDPSARMDEIKEAGARSRWGELNTIPVVPIQSTEAWLLLDEIAIRNVVGRPSGREDLGLPKAKHVEMLSDPKSSLRAALLAASEKTGRRRRQEERSFSSRRRTLLARLDIDGPVSTLTSWRSLVSAIDNWVVAQD